MMTSAYDLSTGHDLNLFGQDISSVSILAESNYSITHHVHEPTWINDTGSLSTAATVVDGRDSQLVIVGLVALSATCLLSLVGNGLVLDRLRLVTYARNRDASMRRNIMILHLCLADLFVIAFNVVPQIAQLATDRFHGNSVMCKMVRYAQVVAMYVSSYVLLTTAIDRYTAICHPLRFRVSGNGRIHRLITVAWSAALLFALPQTVIFDMRWSSRRMVRDCLMMFQPFWTAKLYVLWFTFAVYVLPFSILTLLYARVCFVIWKSRRLQGSNHDKPPERRPRYQSSSPTDDCENVSQVEQHVVRRSRNMCEERSTVVATTGSSGKPNAMRQLDDLITRSDEVVGPRPAAVAAVGMVEIHLVTMSKDKIKDKIKTVKFTVSVIVSYLICWGIYFISLLYSLVSMAPQPPPLVLITLLLGSLNSAINPWIYIFFHGFTMRRQRSSSAQRDSHWTRSTMTTSQNLNQLSLLGKRTRDQPAFAGTHCPPATPVMPSSVTLYPTDF